MNNNVKSSLRAEGVAIQNVLLFILLAFICLFFLGCSSGKPVYSEAATGDGYKIRLMVSNDEISNGGSISVTAYVTDPNGNPVPDEDSVVFFACSQPDLDFDDKKCDIKNGIAATTVKWDDDSNSEDPDPPVPAVITATYKGAVTTIQIVLISEAF